MKRCLLAGVNAFVCLLTATAAAAPADEGRNDRSISLDQIWGYNLPGTRDIAGIVFHEEPEVVGQTYAMLSRERQYNIEQTRQALAIKPPTEKALPGFVLPTSPNSRALRGVFPMLRRKPDTFMPASFREGEEYTLVFFSYPLGYYTRLRKVERVGNEITVYYQFEPHMTPEVTVHFALIPLGALPAGQYRVAYTQIPMEQRYREAGFDPIPPDASEIVSRDFSFKVVGPPMEEPPIEGAKLIPLDQIWAYRMPGTRDAFELGVVRTPDGLKRNPLIDNWNRVIAARIRQDAGPAFVVPATGKEALENAYAALTGEPGHSFPTDTDLSLIFYTHMSGQYVHIERVERIENRIVVTYRFVFHRTRDTSFHFALIPLGKLPSGKYEVEIKQLPLDDEILNLNLTGVVCGDTSFRVKEG